MPKWARTTLEDRVPFIQDLPPFNHYSTSSSLVSQAHSDVPHTFLEAHGISKWNYAMAVEYSSLLNNNTWELVPLTHGRKLVHCKWVYKTKYATDGSIDKYNTYLISKASSHVEGIEYFDMFSPMIKMELVCLVLALTVT